MYFGSEIYYVELVCWLVGWSVGWLVGFGKKNTTGKTALNLFILHQTDTALDTEITN